MRYRAPAITARKIRISTPIRPSRRSNRLCQSDQACAVLVIAGNRAVPALVRPSRKRRRFLQGQERRPDDRLQRRRRLRRLCPPAGAPHGQAHPGQPALSCRSNMQGAGSLGSPTGSTTSRPRTARVFGIIGRGTGFDPLLGIKAAQVRRHQIQLDRQHERRGERLRRLAHLRRHQIRGAADAAARGRRHGRRRRHRSVPAHHQRRARHQDARSSPAIPAATTSASRWSAARCRAAAAGPGRASSPPKPHGSSEKKINILVQLSLRSTPICRMFR